MANAPIRVLSENEANQILTYLRRTVNVNNRYRFLCPCGNQALAHRCRWLIARSVIQLFSFPQRPACTCSTAFQADRQVDHGYGLTLGCDNPVHYLLHHVSKAFLHGTTTTKPFSYTVGKRLNPLFTQFVQIGQFISIPAQPIVVPERPNRFTDL